MSSKKKENTISRALNISSVQKGYVPLADRFKSFPKDSEKEPVTDVNVYYENYSNQTLEHADLGLLYPTADWLRKRLNKQGLVGAYVADENGVLLAGNNTFVVSVEEQ